MPRAIPTITVWLAASLGLCDLMRAETCQTKPNVELTLCDGDRLLPGGLEPVGEALLREFRSIGIPLRWSKCEEKQDGRFRIWVTILPHDARSWNGNVDTLATVFKDANGSMSPVFLFYPAIEEVVGKPTNTSSISNGVLRGRFARGVARIIAHEIVHVLLPEAKHSVAGLFAAELRKHDLLSREFEFNTKIRAALIARLCGPFPETELEGQ